MSGCEGGERRSAVPARNHGVGLARGKISRTLSDAFAFNFMLRFIPRVLILWVAIATSAGALAKTTELRWNELPALPPAAGHARQAGLASPFVGAHGDVLFVAGGANFPDKMPWEG